MGSIMDCKIPLTKNNKSCVTAITAISQATVGVAASVLAASLIELFSAMRIVWIREEKEVKKFLNFFGKDLEKSKIAIVIPQFSLKELKQVLENLKKEERIDEEFKNLLKSIGKEENRMIKSSEGFFSSADMQAAANIQILFDRVKIKDFVKPEFIPTSEGVNADLNADQIKSYNTLFIIGLFSNNFLCNVVNENGANLFELEDNENSETEETGGKIKVAERNTNGQIIQLSKSSQIFANNENENENENEKYGLLARFMCNNQTIFVIGGIEGDLTVKCSDFLLENWEVSIYDKLGSTCKEGILPPDKNFAVCMKLKNDEQLDICYSFIGSPLNCVENGSY